MDCLPAFPAARADQGLAQAGTTPACLPPFPFPFGPGVDLVASGLFLALLQYPVVSCDAYELEPVIPGFCEVKKPKIALSHPPQVGVPWLLSARHPPGDC